MESKKELSRMIQEIIDRLDVSSIKMIYWFASCAIK